MSGLWNWLLGDCKSVALQEEFERLEAKNEELLRLLYEWKATSEVASQERDQVRTEAETMLTQERLQQARTVAELNLQIQQLETRLAEQQQKSRQLEQSHQSLNDLVQFRQQQIDEIQDTNNFELNYREARIREMEQRERDLQTQFDTAMADSVARVDDLSRQLAIANDWYLRDSATATARIEELKRQLTETQARSENRAQQRSALLRNLSEIHRLSSLITNRKLTTSSLKLVPAELDVQESQDEFETYADDIEPVLPPSSWPIYGEVESA